MPAGFVFAKRTQIEKQQYSGFQRAVPPKPNAERIVCATVRSSCLGTRDRGRDRSKLLDSGGEKVECSEEPGLISGGSSFDMVDNDHVNRALAHFEFQSKLLGKRGEQR